MSGTSLDAIDAALVQIERRDDELDLTLLDFVMHPLDNALRQAVRELLPPNSGSTRGVCEVDFALGEAFAAAAQAVARKGKVALSDVDAIASHGQTIYHQPQEPRATLQIAQAAILAERTGCTVISDFRPRDIAAGGQGAPLVPWFDALLFRHENLHRVLLNIGGMANITYLPPLENQASQIIAFDTGPGNVLMDEAMNILTSGAKSFDKKGVLAASGEVHPEMLERWMGHPYFDEAPPKSTGRELFGPEMARTCLAEGYACGLSDAHILATLTQVTAHSIIDAMSRFVPQCDELWVGGGGTLNPVLMRSLQGAFGDHLHNTQEIGLPAEAKEAVAFAAMGYATLHGWPANLPAATGARRAVPLGTITPGENYRTLIEDIAKAPKESPHGLVLHAR